MLSLVSLCKKNYQLIKQRAFLNEHLCNQLDEFLNLFLCMAPFKSTRADLKNSNSRLRKHLTR